jgi:hypothetical protein
MRGPRRDGGCEVRSVRKNGTRGKAIFTVEFEDKPRNPVSL